jgi:hypothetical protein
VKSTSKYAPDPLHMKLGRKIVLPSETEGELINCCVVREERYTELLAYVIYNLNFGWIWK